MTTITRTCDRCGATVQKAEELYVIKLTASGGHYSYVDHKMYEQSAFQSGREWCIDCLVGTGFFYRKDPEIKQPDPLPTLEEMIREIIRSEIPAA